MLSGDNGYNGGSEDPNHFKLAYMQRGRIPAANDDRAVSRT